MRPAFTLLETLVTILIILLLISLSSTTVGKVRNKGREIKCQANQRSLWLESIDYALNHSDPTNFVWTDLRCPSNNLAYSMSGWQDFGRLSLKGGGNNNSYLFRDDSLDILWSDNLSVHRKPKVMGVTFNGKTMFY